MTYDSILNHKAISQSYFFPNSTAPREVFWIETEKAKISCYFHKHPNAEKTIIHFHGNAEVVANYIKSPLCDLECNILFAEYRGFGASTGSPTLLGLFEDIPAIIKAVDTNIEDIIFFGRSVGSIYALHAASLYPNAHALIIESGISDVLQRILMRVQPREIDSTDEIFEKECLKHFNHKEKISNFLGEVLIMHTRYDTVVRSAYAEQLYNWASQPKRMHIFRDGNHNDILHVNEDQYLALVNDLL